MKQIVCLYITLFIGLTSCASQKGIGRIKHYDFAHEDVPAAFDGYRIAFISDLHYKSLFTEKRLEKVVKKLNQLSPDAILMGGDYHEGCEYVDELFDKLGDVQTTDGAWAVLGNHDDEACYPRVAEAMNRNGITLLEHAVDTIRRGGQEIIVAGVRNPFDLKQNGESPTLQLSPRDFVILLVHTPDYAEDVPITNTDLVLAGHTHGGQVTLLGIYAPIIPSHYGQRFRTGMKRTSADIPVIITNGIGTSNKNIRMFAPSEIVMITLRRR